MKDLISIIMPVKNGSMYISECIDSILAQSYDMWELIIVNDHSTDNTLEIIRNHKDGDNRIKLIQNNGKGIISALQTALGHVNGEMITRIDSDDKMTINRLLKMKSKLKDRKTVITGLVKYFSNEYSISAGYKKYEAWINNLLLEGKVWENIYRECVIASPNWMMYTKDFRRIGGFNGLKYPEDYDLVFRWYSEKYAIKTVPEVTLLWRDHSNRISRNSSKYDQSSFFNLKIKKFLEIDDRKNDLLLWGGGQKVKITGQILKRHSRDFTNLTLKNFEKTATYHSPQVLIGIYPEKEERIIIEKYLDSLGLKIGKDYWYL